MQEVAKPNKIAGISILSAKIPAPKCREFQTQLAPELTPIFLTVVLCEGLGLDRLTSGVPI
jgi:hypothetical protein